MKLKINTDKLGSLGAQILIVAVVVILIDALLRLVEWLIGSEWHILAAAFIAALIGMAIIFVAAIAEAKGGS